MASRQRLPIGSGPWIVNEQIQVNELVNQEVEEFSFSVRNEMEWLNEHMAEIFAPGAWNIANVFKTPGKLKGRTPFTAKKRAPQSNRAPLTDIFAPNPTSTSPVKFSTTNKPNLQFSISEDVENQPSPKLSPPKPISQALTRKSPSPAKLAAKSPVRKDVPSKNSDLERRRTTNETFVSAQEIVSNSSIPEIQQKSETEKVQEHDQEHDQETPLAKDQASHADRQEEIVDNNDDDNNNNKNDDDDDTDDTISEGSSPLKPVVRKSSLTFAALPAREPFAAKSSLGPRTSHIDASKSFAGRSSHLGRVTGSRTTNGPVISAITKESQENDTQIRSTFEREDLEATRLQNKTSTQRLHDKINLLGQSRDPRTSKIQSSISMTEKEKTGQPSFSKESSQTRHFVDEDDEETEKVAADDDWIVPLKQSIAPNLDFAMPVQSQESKLTEQISNRLAGFDDVAHKKKSPTRPVIHKKIASTTHLPSPTKDAMAPETIVRPISVSNPSKTLAEDTTTPNGSPLRSPSGRRILDGPLSASKAKFYSVLKSAKGIFASSAGASAIAKMEALSSTRKRKSENEAPASPSDDVQAKHALFPDTKKPDSPLFQGRKTRSSTENRRKEEEERRKASEDLQKMRELERQKATAAALAKMNTVKPPSKIASNKPLISNRVETETKENLASKESEDRPPPPPPKPSVIQTSQRVQSQTQKRAAIPNKIGKDSNSKTKPMAVNLRMPSQRIGHPQSNANANVNPNVNAPNTAILSQSLHDTLPPPVPPKTGLTASKGNVMMSHANSSTTSIKSNTSTAKRAFDAAAKKREQEAKLAQQKANQKRELELKRQQRIEEAKKLEQQRKAVEQQRIQDARNAAQKQAEEAKKQLEQKKEPQRPVSRQQNNLTNALIQEQARAQVHPVQRGDLPGAKPLAKITLVQDSSRPISVNQAKPAKRLFEEDASQRPPMQTNPSSYQQNDAKRRKTEDEELIVEERRSVMVPPVRQSNIRKEPNKFPLNYVQPHTGNQAGAQSIYVKAVTAQHMQHNKSTTHATEMSKFAQGRIPFAETSHASTATMSQIQQHSFKSPGRHGPPSSAAKSVKSSPHFPASESIELPEIMTDSEDDSDNDFKAPSWTESPALRAQLERQQLVDPASIFGPIAPLRMDEVFRNKDRQKKFRDRTSSANWGGADRLTEEERRKDRKARERLMQDGGWDMLGQKEAMGSPWTNNKREHDMR